MLPGEYQTAAFVEPSLVSGRANKPNTEGWKRASEFTTWVRVNSKGLRGPEIDYAKAAGVHRILVLGDSFTFALQVAEEETFVARLAGRLNDSRAPLRIETINAGTDGWSTANEYAWLVSEGYRYEPDLVLVMFFEGNDPGDNADQIGTLAQAEQLRLGEDAGRPLELLRERVRGLSVVYNVFEQALLARFSAAPTSVQVLEEQPRDSRPSSPRSGEPAEPRMGSLNSERKLRGWLKHPRFPAGPAAQSGRQRV